MSTTESQSIYAGTADGNDAIKVTSNDASEGFLQSKLVAGAGVTLTENNNGGNETLTIASTIVNTDQVAKVSSNDTTSGYLNGKLVAGAGVTLTENSDGGNETLTIANTVVNTDQVAKVSSNDTTAGFLNGKLVAGSNITLTENNDGSNETLTINAAAGGLTAFVESKNTASPNNTVHASRLLVDASTADADAVLQPKGGGALLAQLPDNTTLGGTKRGTRSVDLQLERGLNYHVVTGQDSFAAGSRNTVSGFWNFAAGIQNTVSNSRNFAFGENNNVNGSNCAAFGYANTASANYGFVSGATNTLSSTAHYSVLFGSGGQLNVAGALGQAAGLTQHNTHLMSVQLATNWTASLLCAGLSKSSGGALKLTQYRAHAFTGLVTARNQDGNKFGAWKIEGAITYDLSGTAALLGTPVITVFGNTLGGSSGITVSADNVYKALDIVATGIVNETTYWAASVELTFAK